MCTPTMLAVGAIAATAVGTGVQMYGQAQAASAAKSQAAYQAQVAQNQATVARNNATYADTQATDATNRGSLAEKQYRLQVSQLAGRQRASLAANGVVVDSGSALDITTDTATLGEQDALTIRSNAAREALGYKQQAYNFRSDASGYDATAGLDIMKGNAAASAAQTGMLSTLIGGAGSVASKWYSYNQKKVPGFY